MVFDALAVDAGEMLFVSSNAGDVLGAIWFGFYALWVNRRGLPSEAIIPRPGDVGTEPRPRW